MCLVIANAYNNCLLSISYWSIFVEAIKESRSRVEVMERTVNLLQEDLSVAKQNLSETTKKWLEQEEKLHVSIVSVLVSHVLVSIIEIVSNICVTLIRV